MKPDPQALLETAKLRGYKFKPNDDGGYNLVLPPNRDLGFEKQLSQNYYAVIGLVQREIPPKPITTPMKAALDATPEGQQRKNWINKGNEFINNLIAPGGSNFEPAEEAKSLARFLIPQSATGKAAMLASLPFGGEGGLASKALSIAAPAIAGGVTSELSGEMSPLSGAAVGGVSGALGTVPGIIGDAAKFIRRNKIYKISDEARMAEVFDKIVNLPGISSALKSGKKAWYDVFAQLPATKEAGSKIEAARVGIANAVDATTPRAARAMNTYFQMVHGVPLSKVDRSAASKVDKRIIGAANQGLDDLNFLTRFGNEFRNNLKTLGTLGKKAFQQGYHADDVLKEGPGAKEAADEYAALAEKIDKNFDKLEALNQQYNLKLPNFKQLHAKANADYAKFAGIRDLSDLALKAQKQGKPVQKEIIDHLRTDPRNLQARFGDQWHVINYLGTRRGAEDIGPGGDFEHTDIPSLLQNMHIRASGAGGHGALFTSIKGLRHPFGKYIGKSAVEYGNYGIPTQAVSKLLSTETSHLADPLAILNKDTDNAIK